MPLLAIGVLLLHVVVNAMTPYGIQRDEFLYMAMGRHLRLWQMDFPPFIAIASQLSRLFGDSLIAIRIIPALSASAIVILAGLLAAEMGGGAIAQSLAAVCVVCAPQFLRPGAMLQPVVLDQLWWTAGYYALARIARARRSSGELSTESRRWWIVLGAIAGVGLLTKFSIAFFAAGVVAGVVITPLRRALATPWPWIAAAIGLAIGSPSIVGQILLHFPVVGQMRDLQREQLQHVTVGSFLAGQLSIGASVIIAAMGIIALIGGPLVAFRSIGIATLVSWLVLLVSHGKSYYAYPIFPVLFAAGAAMIDSISRTNAPAARWKTPALIVEFILVIAYGFISAPYGLPILPPAAMARFAARSGSDAGVKTNTGQKLKLPQDYADMLGWPEQTALVARVYSALTPAERAQTVIAAGNYGEAGALDFYGPARGLPPVISSAGSYWFFGPGTLPGAIMLVLANRDSFDDLEKLYENVQIVAPVQSADHDWLTSDETDAVLFRCDHPRRTIQQAWPALAGKN